MSASRIMLAIGYALLAIGVVREIVDAWSGL